MRTKNVLLLLLPFYLLSCGLEEKNDDEMKPLPVQLKNVPGQDIIIDDRFLSKDREVEKIFADYEKPIESYPTIWQSESVTKKNGRLYRKDVWDEPFTGTVVERFPDGSVSLETSYYRGLPHGQQNRNFESGQLALQANFDQGVLVGVKSRWWPTGILREEAYWSEGKYIGRRLWDQTGRLMKEEIVPQG
ncbi:MAG: hypothetical protein HN548_09545 [Opitutae bacterium]|nr:hypothetical protein [Opitutae bacterium]MBT5715863.1 hypothetical protein [Opitutae bacterium]